jgi:hypothetical protein
MVNELLTFELVSEILLLVCFYTFLQATGTMRELICRTGSPLILNSAFCFRFMLTWLEVERWRSRGVSNRVNMESRRKAQIFPMWASGINSNVLHVTMCCRLIYMVSTQVLKYYRRLLRIVTQTALAALFSVPSIANFFWQRLPGYPELVQTVVYMLVHCCHLL